MKLKLAMLALAGAVSFSATAQNEGVLKARKVAYEKSTNDNWFVSLQGGAGVMMNGDNGEAKFADRIGFNANVAVGKWHNPYYATRLQVVGGEAKTFLQMPKTPVSDAMLLEHKNYFVGVHYDFMFDLVNYFSSYPASSAFHLVPFVGLGYEYKFESSRDFADVHGFTANAGLQLGISLAKRVDLLIEGGATWNAPTFTGKQNYPIAFENNLRLAATAGLRFNLGKVGFKMLTPMDEALMARLRNEINALEAENAELAKRPESCPEAVETKLVLVEDHFVADKTIVFRHACSRVSSDQHIQLHDAAKFVKEKEGKLVVTGYIQKAESRYRKLAEKRAKAVAKLLSERFEVPAEAIIVEWKSADEAPLKAKRAWDRIVTIRTAK